MKYRTCLLVFVLCFYMATDAQNNPAKTYFAELPKSFIKLEQFPDSNRLLIPFDNIEILDSRADTSFLGFVSNAYKSIHKISFDAQFTDVIKKHIAETYLLIDKNDSKSSLLIVIKKMMLTEFISADANLDPSQTAWDPGIVFSADVFAVINNKYKVWHRIDTILSIDKRLYKNEPRLIQNVIRLCFEKPGGIKVSEATIGKKSFSLEEIKAYYNKRFSYPILNDPIYKKGVYRSFSEFTKNNPGIAEFEVRKDKKTDALYITENGNESLARNCWGYCDGKDIYIKSGDNFFLLYRSRNAFNFLGFKEIVRHKQLKVSSIIMNGLATTLISKNGKKIIYKGDITALQLDMETGEVY